MANQQRILPLTTTFTPPASCSSSWTYNGLAEPSIFLQNALPSPSFDSSCFPPGFTGFTGNGFDDGQVFSPGVCPFGYTTATTVLASDGSITTGICCSKGFTLQSTPVAGTGGVQNVAGCVSTYNGGETIVPEITFAAGSFQLTTTSAIGPVLMWAQPITIAHQKEDFTLPLIPSTASSVLPLPNAQKTITEIHQETISPSLASAPFVQSSSVLSSLISSSSTLPSSTRSSSIFVSSIIPFSKLASSTLSLSKPSSSTPSSLPSSTPPSQISHHLPRSAIIAIPIASPVLLLIILIALLFNIRKRKRKQAQSNSKGSTEEAPLTEKAKSTRPNSEVFMQDNQSSINERQASSDFIWQKAELSNGKEISVLYGERKVELSTEREAIELHGVHRVELPTGREAVELHE